MKRLARPLLLLASALGLATTATAQPLQADTATTAPAVYVQQGFAQHAAHSQTVGVLLPWLGFERAWLGQHWQGYWDIYAARWRADDTLAGGARNTLALGITPTLRMTPQGGQSRWFVDMGLGLVLSDRHYANQARRQSTRYNFASSLAVGLWLDSARRHALSLQVQHVSNASLKKPNPGENFVQVRYARAF